MDEFKFKPLEDWLKDAKKDDCGDFLALAINKNHKMCSVGSCSFENMLEMLLTSADKNEPFRNALMATASIISEKMKQEQEGGGQ